MQSFLAGVYFQVISREWLWLIKELGKIFSDWVIWHQSCGKMSGRHLHPVGIFFAYFRGLLELLLEITIISWWKFKETISSTWTPSSLFYRPKFVKTWFISNHPKNFNPIQANCQPLLLLLCLECPSPQTFYRARTSMYTHFSNSWWQQQWKSAAILLPLLLRCRGIFIIFTVWECFILV